MEIWRDINGYPNYEVSTFGNVRNKRTLRVLKPFYNNKRKYLLVDLGKKIQVHRLVALAFIDNPDNLPQIDHIDYDPSNNNINNLRWISPKDNCDRRKRVVGASISFKDPYWVVQYQANGKNNCKYFKEDDYESAEQFYFEKCGDF